MNSGAPVVLATIQIQASRNDCEDITIMSNINRIYVLISKEKPPNMCEDQIGFALLIFTAF